MFHKIFKTLCLSVKPINSIERHKYTKQKLSCTVMNFGDTLKVEVFSCFIDPDAVVYAECEEGKKHVFDYADIHFTVGRCFVYGDFRGGFGVGFEVHKICTTDVDYEVGH